MFIEHRPIYPITSTPFSLPHIFLFRQSPPFIPSSSSFFTSFHPFSFSLFSCPLPLSHFFPLSSSFFFPFLLAAIKFGHVSHLLVGSPRPKLTFDPWHGFRPRIMTIMFHFAGEEMEKVNRATLKGPRSGSVRCEIKYALKAGESWCLVWCGSSCSAQCAKQ